MSASVSERLTLPDHVPSAAVFDSDLYRVSPAMAPLARIELETLYEEWLARIPPFRIDTAIPQTFTGGAYRKRGSHG